MLLSFVIWSTIALCIANPLHKYPYVFLLDVGNEELEKTNTEQLRISIPGGSLAMKYPAMGEGDPISHVRVSGIDFGTDLKVNILEGGPGYKYVVLIFMGNSGVNYDAVVTLQTLETAPRSTDMSTVNNNYIGSTENLSANTYEVSDADSDENEQDMIDNSKNMKEYSKKSKEVMQSSSTFYNYAKGAMVDDDEDKESENVSAEEADNNDDDSADDSDEEEIEDSNHGEQRFSNDDKSESSYKEGRIVSNDDVDESVEEDESVEGKLYNGQNYNEFSDVSRLEKYGYDVNLNKEYKPHLTAGYRIYPQAFIYNKQYQGNSPYNKEDPVEFQHSLNNEEIHDDSRFKDVSNNIDSDYLVAEY